MNYILTGRPFRGKSTLVAWLCGRLPRPIAGIRTFCTGRAAGGPIYSMQDLLTGEIVPFSRPEGDQIVSIPETFEEFGVRALCGAAASGAPLVVVDQIGRYEAHCPHYMTALESLLEGPQTLVVAVKKEDLPHLNALCSRPEDCLIDLDQMTHAQAREMLARQLPPRLHPGVSLRLFQEEKCFGPGPLQILDLVARTGSLHSAAAVMGMSYSKAWKILGTMEQQWGFSMLERHPGGVGGGGSTLTDQAWELLARYRALEWETARAVQESFQRHFDGFP